MTRTQTRADGDPGALQVIHVALGDLGEDVFTSWIVERTMELIGQLRDAVLAAPGDHAARIVVVLSAPAQSDHWRAAAAAGLCEAARGVVGALTLERGASLRLNLVLTETSEREEVRETLAFLALPKADFLAGSTFDLRAGR